MGFINYDRKKTMKNFFLTESDKDKYACIKCGYVFPGKLRIKILAIFKTHINLSISCDKCGEYEVTLQSNSKSLAMTREIVDALDIFEYDSSRQYIISNIDTTLYKDNVFWDGHDLQTLESAAKIVKILKKNARDKKALNLALEIVGLFYKFL
jgi:hypothetical protein